jgi:hypothetical protein
MLMAREIPNAKSGKFTDLTGWKFRVNLKSRPGAASESEPDGVRLFLENSTAC